jgi:hypothetical protein
MSTTGCHATYPVRSPLVPDSRELFVRFHSPRELEAATADGAPRRLSEVQVVRGRAISVRNDTLALRVARILQIARPDRPLTWRPVSPPVTVAVALGDQSLRIEEERISPGRTMAAVLLGAPVVAFALAAMRAGNR